ncbi:MAG: tetratricopeptide repeat protein, partial [Erythrobacter sp.]|nr:tetratricopeptide repeat protein [Erythrobacter sp.]
SYGRNLLGRAFLDAGDPRTAATHFLANYNADHAGARAPHSLLYLAESMIALDDTRRACIALSVFGDEYPALASGELAGQYGSLRGRVDCD